MPGAVSRSLDASPSLVDSFPTDSSHSQLLDATAFLGLDLPQNAMNVIAQRGTLGRLPPALLNSRQAVQPPPVQGASKSVTTARTHSIARSHPQPNALKSRGSSAYARGVPISKPIPQPSEAVHYQSPPLKARIRRTKSKATKAPIAGASTSASESQPETSHLAMARATTERPGLGDIPIDILLQIIPGLPEVIARNKAGRQSNSSVGDMGPLETGIFSDSETDSESSGSSDTGVLAMEVPPVQLQGSPPPIVQPGQSPLIEQLRFIPAIRDNIKSPIGFSAAIPTIQFPDFSNSYPTCEDHEGPQCTAQNSQVSSIESGNRVSMGEAGTDLDSIGRLVDWILDGGLESFVNPESP